MIKRSNAEWFRRIISFILSLFVLGIGVALTIRANLGSSPITCPPYVLSMIPSSPLTVGGWIFVCSFSLYYYNGYCCARIFRKFRYYNSVSVCCLVFLRFGHVDNRAVTMGRYFVGLCRPLGSVGCSRCNTRCRCYLGSSDDILLIPGEGLPITISRVFHIDFGKVKIAFDVLVAVAVICCYMAFGRWRWDLVGAGTLFPCFMLEWSSGLFRRT